MGLTPTVQVLRNLIVSFVVDSSNTSCSNLVLPVLYISTGRKGHKQTLPSIISTYMHKR